VEGGERFLTEDFFNESLKDFDLKERDVNALPPLVLAFIGDAVYDVYVRTLLISKGGKNVHSLHVDSISYVKAGSQSDILKKMAQVLTDEESEIVRRGRNSNPSTVPKNADVTEYRYATGFEALLGYLYLTNRLERLMEILRMSVNIDH
jgi:ribonuclease-3 family protein